jgi:hypothetical protein
MLDMEPRKAFFRDVAAAIPTRQSFPMMHEIPIPPIRFERLRRALHAYVAATIAATGRPTHGAVETDEFLALNYADLVSCPNITPNGVILPKLENHLEFNIVHREVAGIFAATCLPPFFAKMHLPMSIRLVGGEPNEAAHKRPFAATKLHTEIWSGHPNDGVISIPISGNVAGTMPEFFEPIEPSEKFIHKVQNYDDGLSTYRDLKQYDMQVAAGFYYLYDAFVVHRTVKRGGGPRISIDFPVIYAKSLGLLDLPKDRLENYIDRGEWMRYGATRLLFSPESFADITARLEQERAHPAATLRYAATFERVNLAVADDTAERLQRPAA